MKWLKYLLIFLITALILTSIGYFFIYKPKTKTLPIETKTSEAGQEDLLFTALLKNEDFMTRVRTLMNNCTLSEKGTDNLCIALYNNEEASEACKKITINSEFGCQDIFNAYKSGLANDIVICDKINKAEVRAYCNAVLNKDRALCDKFPTKDEQYKCAAITSRETSLCNKISDEASRQSCQDEITGLLALQTRSIKECDNIKDETLLRICKSQISKNPEFCDIPSTRCEDPEYFNANYLQVYDVEQATLKKIILQVYSEMNSNLIK